MFGIEGDPDDGADGDDRRRQAPDLRGHGEGGRARLGAAATRSASSSTSSSAATIPRAGQGRRASSSRCRSRSPARTSSTSSTATTSASTSTSFDPDFSKVLVRYNPDGDAETNRASSTRSSASATGCTSNDRKFLFELLVPGRADAQLESVGGDTDRYDAELRPELMRRAIEELQDFGIEVDIWKIEGVDERADAEMLAEQTRTGDGPRERRLRAARPRRQRRQGRPLAAAGRAGRGLRRLRDRPLDLVGRAEGLPRRRLDARGGGRSRSPTTTCASSRSTRTQSAAVA